MAYQLAKLNSDGTAFPIDADELGRRIDNLLEHQSQRFRRLWMYYRNPMLPRTSLRDEQGSDRPYRQGQEWGLPSRVTGCTSGADPLSAIAVDGVARKEVVIENDIAWRIDTMVDFLFGKSITIGSNLPDPARRAQIESLLMQILERNGGTLLLQQIALLGAVHGFVDVLVKLDTDELNDSTQPTVPATDASPASIGGDAEGIGSSLPPCAEPAPRAGQSVSAPHLDDFPDTGASHLPSLDAHLTRIARLIRLEVVEPARALPLLSESDWRDVRAYVQVYQISRQTDRPRSAPPKRWLSRVLAQLAPARSIGNEDGLTTVVEILTPARWQRYEDEILVNEGACSLGEIPLVHIQNLAVPFEYSGKSDVEQLAPLQDELNTRLSDRANRITMQSFKMYLGKGIDGFTDLPVAPGRMWVTDNDNADVIEFGGDPASPSEDEHIAELREAMDKASGVTPIAAGAIRGRVGNLTSAAALRVTLMALLAKTERKRSTYGLAIERICELALAWLDRAGVFHTSPDERQVELRWPGLLPDSQLDRLREAQIKRNLGVSPDQLLRELGYIAPSTKTNG